MKLRVNKSFSLLFMIIMILSFGMKDTTSAKPVDNNSISVDGLPLPPVITSAEPLNQRARINWTYSDPTATSFRVYNATPAGVAGLQMSTPSLNGNSRSVIIQYFAGSGTPLVNFRTYYFVMTAINGTGQSVVSNVISVTPEAGPSNPIGFTAYPYPSYVSLSWQAPLITDPGLVHYRLNRSMDGVSFTQHALISPTSIFYNDTGLINGQTYYYRLQAYNGYGYSGVVETNAKPIAGPSAVNNLTYQLGTSWVYLTWTEPTNNGGAFITDYSITRAIDINFNFNVVYYSTSAVTLYFNDTYNLQANTTYYYKISAVNGGPIGAETILQVQIPGVPNQPLNVVATNGGTYANITWNEPSSNLSPIQYYMIYRTTNEFFPTTYIGNSTTTTFIDTSVVNDTIYFYAVSAVNDIGEGYQSWPQAQVHISSYSNPVISDNVSPDISSPNDVTYIVGSTGNSIVWTVGDTHPDVYNITLHGIEYRSTTNWVNGTITLNIDGLEVGTYTFIIWVYDTYNNKGTDSVSVTVISPISDSVSPDVSSPNDITYNQGSTGNTIVWVVGDVNPSVYNVTMNGNTYTSTINWLNGSITLQIDGLGVGTYTFVIYVYDLYGNKATDAVIVNVISNQQPPSSISSNTNSSAPVSDSSSPISGLPYNYTFTLISILSLAVIIRFRSKNN
ncbi:MAG: hypothetical protein OEY49_03730 [Candidatus Heimdallarchaeota archaeon]|nr:hypothetical protein [Candidatus Heimdallarchaeota archaeon]